MLEAVEVLVLFTLCSIFYAMYLWFFAPPAAMLRECVYMIAYSPGPGLDGRLTFDPEFRADPEPSLWFFCTVFETRGQCLHPALWFNDLKGVQTDSALVRSRFQAQLQFQGAKL